MDWYGFSGSAGNSEGAETFFKAWAVRGPPRIFHAVNHQTGGRSVSEQLPSPERPYPLDHEGRIARLEGIVEQIDARLGRIETKIDANHEALDAKIDANRESVETKIDANRESVETKIDANRESVETKIDRLYRWAIPLQLTTILAIAGLAFKAFSG